jgi:hypothetical protein
VKAGSAQVQLLSVRRSQAERHGKCLEASSGGEKQEKIQKRTFVEGAFEFIF